MGVCVYGCMCILSVCVGVYVSVGICVCVFGTGRSCDVGYVSVYVVPVLSVYVVPVLSVTWCLCCRLRGAGFWTDSKLHVGAAGIHADFT